MVLSPLINSNYFIGSDGSCKNSPKITGFPFLNSWIFHILPLFPFPIFLVSYKLYPFNRKVLPIKGFLVISMLSVLLYCYWQKKLFLLKIVLYVIKFFGFGEKNLLQLLPKSKEEFPWLKRSLPLISCNDNKKIKIIYKGGYPLSIFYSISLSSTSSIKWASPFAPFPFK